MLFLDTESCGLNGPCVLIQWAQDNGPVSLHHVWSETADATLLLIENLVECRHTWVTWNHAHDQWVIQRLHNVLSLLPPDEVPTAEAWIAVERDAWRGPCVKPYGVLDLMLHAQRGPLQVLMGRKPIRVRRVPRSHAQRLADELNRRVDLSVQGVPHEAFFEKRKAVGWAINEDASDEDWCEVKLSFGASTGLKACAKYLLGEDVHGIDELPLEWPNDPGHHHFGTDWARVLDSHVRVWAEHPKAQDYARNDIDWLRRLWRHFGSPVGGHYDDWLTSCAGSVRHRGYTLDHDVLDELYEKAQDVAQAAGDLDWRPVRKRLDELVSPIEWAALKLPGGTDTKKVLQPLIRKLGDAHPGSVYAQTVIDGRTAVKVIERIDKLRDMGARAHFAFKIGGAKSGRASGGQDTDAEDVKGGKGSLNPQGIPGRHPVWKRMRAAFPMKDADMPMLDAGDFDASQIAVMAACYDDPAITAQLEAGIKFHRVWGAEAYEVPVEEFLEGTPKYKAAKNDVFATAFGAQERKRAETLGLTVEEVKKFAQRLKDKYPGFAREQDRIKEGFSPLRQRYEDGPIDWHDAEDYVESLLGYRRYFTLEWRACRALFDLSQNPPPAWDLDRRKIKRVARKTQTPGGCVRSALYGAAFAIQSSAQRQAGNHRIQATDSEITKVLQRRIWDLQPSGIHPWRVAPMSIHDEIVTPRAADVDLKPVVAGVLDEYRAVVPLIHMDWNENLSSWAEK